MVGVCLIFKKLTNCFPKWLYDITFPPALYQSSIFPVLPSTLPGMQSSVFKPF